MDKKVFSTTDLIEQIINYQNKNSELLRSHYFVFDCPLGSNTQLKPEFIWMGINPGKDEEDWKKTKNKNDEEVMILTKSNTLRPKYVDVFINKDPDLLRFELKKDFIKKKRTLKNFKFDDTKLLQEKFL